MRLKLIAYLKPFLAQIALLNDIQRKAKGYRLFSKDIVKNPFYIGKNGFLGI